MMTRILLLCALLAACAPKPPDVENVALPSGTTVKEIGSGPAPTFLGMPTLGLRYLSDVDFDNTPALHDEATKVWHFFRLQAEGHRNTSAVVTAQSPQGRRMDFHFERVKGVWREVDASGKPIDASPPTLHGRMTAFAWMLGTWNCDFNQSANGKTAHFTTIVIAQAGTPGTTIDETYAGSWGSGAILGEYELGYDASRNVWYQHGRQSTGATENDEAHGAFSRDMSFVGTIRPPGVPALQIDKRVQVNSNGNSWRSTTMVRGSVVGDGTCAKQRS